MASVVVFGRIVARGALGLVLGGIVPMVLHLVLLGAEDVAVVRIHLQLDVGAVGHLGLDLPHAAFEVHVMDVLVAGFLGLDDDLVLGDLGDAGIGDDLAVGPDLHFDVVAIGALAVGRPHAF